MDRTDSQAMPDAKSRREFLKYSGTAAAVSALTGMALPRVHTADGMT
ncbi:MAG: twin-arginine translocation signal domain-containing protein, partial [Pirellulales bacterium]|nr:twin-arginine translocation signal domain-containing protein [Pirellulales bacterium]